MPRLLVTGFEPFGGEPTNPSLELVRWLEQGAARERGVSLDTAVMPVDRSRYAAALAELIERRRPHAVIALGQATGRPTIDLESTAHNAIDYRGQRDNGGHEALGEALEPNGPEALETPIALGTVRAALVHGGHPVALSTDAGRHLCNALYYDLLRRRVPALFVHVPLLPEQAARRGLGEPSLDADVTRACLLDLLQLLPEHLPARP